MAENAAEAASAPGPTPAPAVAGEEAAPSPPGPGEPGYDKLAVPRYILELLRKGHQGAKVVEQVKARYPYSRVNPRHVAWMASAQAFGDLEPE